MDIRMEPVAIVRSSRAEPIDDDWDAVESYIELCPGIPEETLAGLASFSHIEVFYFFHKVDRSKIVLGAEHPRENKRWPLIGIFAQRKKARPNLLGATIVPLVGIDGRRIRVRSLDAIDGTPVLDIKPVFSQYLPRGEVRQPEWVDELMEHYW